MNQVILPQTRSNFLDKTHSENSFKKISAATYSKCGHAWSYLGKMALLTRSLLNSAARNVYFLALTGIRHPQKIINFTTSMKILSIVGVPFSIGDINATAKKILNGIIHKDKEGIALSALTFTVIAADIIDSVTTFINTTLFLSASAPVAIFSAMGLPLGFTMSGVGTISRTIQVAKAMNLYRNIEKEIRTDNHLNKDSLRAFLEKTLGVTDELKVLMSTSSEQLSEKQKMRIEHLKETNRAAILRTAPPAVAESLKSLLDMLNDTSTESLSLEKQEEILKTLKHIQNHLVKKLKIDGLSIAANLFSLTALTLFALGSSTSAPFLTLCVAFSIRLAVVYYQDHKIIK
jgi:hypothetical protein